MENPRKGPPLRSQPCDPPGGGAEENHTATAEKDKRIQIHSQGNVQCQLQQTGE